MKCLIFSLFERTRKSSFRTAPTDAADLTIGLLPKQPSQPGTSRILNERYMLPIQGKIESQSVAE